MDESKNTANKKQSRQKPPLSVVRIAGEILAGMALGLVALPVVYLINIMIFGKSDYSGSVGGLHALAFLGILMFFFPPLYTLGNAVGVSLVGNRGDQTGSDLATLGGALLGLIVILLLWPLVFLTVPIMATLGFNLTRRYKVQKKQTGSAKSVARTILMVLAVCSIVPVMMYIGGYGLMIPVILIILALVLK